MGFYLSAGVYTQERDISTIVPAVSTTIGALVGYSKKGSLDIVLVTNSQQFIAEYGEPTPGDYFHYTALAFLEHGTQLYCRRIVNGALYPGITVVTSGSSDENAAFTAGQSTPVFYDDSGTEDDLFNIFAKDPGVWGNLVSCIIKNIKTISEDDVLERYTFEIDVYVTDAEGTTSKVENWKVSRQVKVDGYGRQMYLEDRINGYSSYIRVADNTSTADTTLPKANATAVTMTGGSIGSAVTASQIIGVESAASGWYGFYNYDEIDVRILMDAGYTSSHTSVEIATIQTAMNAIAVFRRDCIAVLSVPHTEAATAALSIAYRNNGDANSFNINSSYSALYAPFVKINDAFNDRIIEVPPAGYIGAHMALTDYVSDTWMAPAGFNRGILNVLSAQVVYTEGNRNTLQPEGVNPIQVFRGEGVVIWGQRTLQKKASALDRVNVRRMLISLEKALAISLRPFVFEANSDITRFRISGMVREYLDRLSSMGAFQLEAGDDGYAVICDETNNTSQVIDANELHVDVFVKPIKSAEFIRLQTIITTTGTSFEELISRGVLL